jgi:hypothetical protein
VRIIYSTGQVKVEAKVKVGIRVKELDRSMRSDSVKGRHKKRHPNGRLEYF